MSRVLGLVLVFALCVAAQEPDQCPRIDPVSPATMMTTVTKFLLPSTQSESVDRLRLRCSDPWVQTVQRIALKMINNVTISDQVKAFNSRYPHLAALSLDVVHTMLRPSENLSAKERNWEKQMGLNNFLQFLDDATIQTTPQCSLLATFLGWNTLMYTALFIIKNPWFFFSSSFPHEVPGSELANHSYGMWAFASSITFALAAGYCLNSSLSHCDVSRLMGTIAAFPSFILLMWGLVSAAARTGARDQDSAEAVPTFATAEPYKWRLNVFPSQVEESAILRPKDSGLDSPLHASSKKAQEGTTALALAIGELKKRGIRTSLTELLRVFFLNKTTLCGFAALIASMAFASISCDNAFMQQQSVYDD